jgi:glucose-1-phosphate cytidylyltransferase
MKVVLFCGGLGTRLREYSETIPKPMVEIGGRPLMWHLMRYYAHFGHKDFILCLGYKGEYTKEYFLNHGKVLSDDLTPKSRRVRWRDDDEDWTISFVETGLSANIGQRLMAVKEYLVGDDVFMANYSDGLADLDLKRYLDQFFQSGKIASFLCVKPSQSFHVVTLGQDDQVQQIAPAVQSDLWINGGFFVFKADIFNYVRDGEELVHEPFHRLMADHQLVAFRNEGFWACIDTLRDKQMFDDMVARGETPWAVWESSGNSALGAAQPNGAVRETDRDVPLGVK